MVLVHCTKLCQRKENELSFFTITFKKTMEVREPYVTVLGQTAPGKGIALAVDGSEKGEVITIHTNDVVLRHLRVRPGPSDLPSCCRSVLQILFNYFHLIILIFLCVFIFVF